MKKRSGFVLLSILLFFTVLVLSSTVGVLERDTGLKRFSEEDLRINLGAIRRGIDLYRYKYTVTAPDPAKITALETALNTGVATEVANVLADESFIRARIATGSMKWLMVTNLIQNPSFEDDSGKIDYGTVGTWRGNFTADDGVPDGWKLNVDGAEQMVNITANATYIVSFWARCENANARARLKIWDGGALPVCELVADQQIWKRYYTFFDVTAAPVDLKLELVQAGLNSGDQVYVDGIMLEKWTAPAGLPASYKPVPSAWTADFNVIPAQATQVLQERLFKELIPPASDPSSYSWWFQW